MDNKKIAIELVKLAKDLVAADEKINFSEFGEIFMDWQGYVETIARVVFETEVICEDESGDGWNEPREGGGCYLELNEIKDVKIEKKYRVIDLVDVLHKTKTWKNYTGLLIDKKSKLNKKFKKYLSGGVKTKLDIIIDGDDAYFTGEDFIEDFEVTLFFKLKGRKLIVSKINLNKSDLEDEIYKFVERIEPEY